MCDPPTSVMDRTMDFDAKDKFGLTLLHLVCQYPDDDMMLPILNLLMYMRVDVNCQDDYGSTPLHHCVHFQNHVAMKYLINAGASLDNKDKSGKTVIDWAKMEGGHTILQLLNRPSPCPFGVSDERINCLLPFCCEQGIQSRVKINGENKIEINFDQVDGWLSKYSVCQHNANVILHKAIPSLQSNQELTRLEAEEASKIFTDVLTVLQRTAVGIEESNPLFKSIVIAGGSVAELTKIGPIDEMDFVFCLTSISEMVEIEEPVSDNEKGHARLKPVNPSELGEFVDAGGYIRRSELSEKFHNLFGEAFLHICTFENTRLFSLEGTVDNGHYLFNIGQLLIIWYGHIGKQLSIKLDIVPSLKKKGWRSEYLLEDMKIVDQSVVDISCLLIMQVPDILYDIEDDQLHKRNNELFRISFARTEHSILRNLPPVIRDGYRIAKSVLELCPRLRKIWNPARCPDEFITTNPLNEHRWRDMRYIENGTFWFSPKVHEAFGSYDLKTALLHVLHDERIKTDTPGDFDDESWNEIIIHHLAHGDTRDPNVSESLVWAKRIFSKLKFFILKQRHHNHSYFLAMKESLREDYRTRMNVALKDAYCKIVLRLLDDIDLCANEKPSNRNLELCEAV